MSKKSETEKIETTRGKRAPNGRAPGIATTNTPFHFTGDMAKCLQAYNEKTANFISDRIEDDLVTFRSLMDCRDYGSFFETSARWWNRMGSDYLGHYSNFLELQTEVKSELQELSDTEAEIAKAKTEDLVENSPV